MSADPLDPALEVDWVTRSALADRLTGRLGLTFLPGKSGASLRYPGRVYRRDLGRDLDALRAAGVRRLVLLVTDDELARWGDPDIVARGEAAGIGIVRHPIPDGSAPSSREAVEAILDDIGEGRGTGDVAVACMGGVGRSGTVVACVLVAAGWDPDAAIGEVRRVRHPTAVETDEQTAFVHQYWRERTGPRRATSDTVSP